MIQFRGKCSRFRAKVTRIAPKGPEHIVHTRHNNSTPSGIAAEVLHIEHKTPEEEIVIKTMSPPSLNVPLLPAASTLNGSENEPATTKAELQAVRHIQKICLCSGLIVGVAVYGILKAFTQSQNLLWAMLPVLLVALSLDLLWSLAKKLTRNGEDSSSPHLLAKLEVTVYTVSSMGVCVGFDSARLYHLWLREGSMGWYEVPCLAVMLLFVKVAMGGLLVAWGSTTQIRQGEEEGMPPPVIVAVPL